MPARRPQGPDRKLLRNDDVEGVTGPVAENGIYHETENPDGEVLVPGYLYEVRNIPDFNKGANTMLELVAIVKL